MLRRTCREPVGEFRIELCVQLEQAPVLLPRLGSVEEALGARLDVREHPRARETKDLRADRVDVGVTDTCKLDEIGEEALALLDGQPCQRFESIPPASRIVERCPQPGDVDGADTYFFPLRFHGKPRNVPTKLEKVIATNG